jgi:hypothetical protein
LFDRELDGPRRHKYAIGALRDGLGENVVQPGRTLPHHKDGG